MSDYLPGLWQVVDFRLDGGARAIWDRPPLHVVDDGGAWVVHYMSPVLVIATTRYHNSADERCFFIHESLVDELMP